jgi:hypothetical protein
MAGKFSAADFGLPEHLECPFCQGRDTELHSPFGSQLAVATYWCKRCRTAFEFIKTPSSLPPFLSSGSS